MRYERNVSAYDSTGSALLTSIRPRNDETLPRVESEGSEVGAEEQAHREVGAVDDDDLEDWDDPEIKRSCVTSRRPQPRRLRNITPPTSPRLRGAPTACRENG